MENAQSATRLILIMCIAEVLGMAGVFAFPALLPRFLQDWGLTNTEAGWINGIYYAGYTLAVPVLASLTDRVDARRVYLASAVVAASAALGFALFAHGFWTACVFRALGGLGLAGTYIPGLKVLVDRLRGTAQARAVAIYTATFGIGTSLSFFGAGELGARFGWRWAFAFAAASAGLALVLAATAIRPKSPESMEVPDTRLLDFRPVLRNRKAMSYVLAYAAHMWELFAMRSWMVAFLAFSLSLQPSEEGHWSPATIAALAALVAVGANVGGAELAIRFGRRRILTLIMWSSALFAFGFGYTAALPYPLVAGLCVLYTMLVTADSGAIHTGAVLSAEPERRGATMAIQSLLGFAIASVSPLVIGVVLDATGSGQSVKSWGAAFIAMGVVVALGPIILALLAPKSTTDLPFSGAFRQ
jgi:MFS family permease